MSETVIAIGLTATCSDGSVHQDVVMKVVDDVVIFNSQDGEHLCGKCCVKQLDHATIVVPPPSFSAAMFKYRQQEAG